MSTCAAFLRDVYGLQLTHGQSAFVRVAIDGCSFEGLTEDEREAAEQMFGDVSNVPEVARRTVVAALGRSSGKTEICAGIAIFKALTVDLSKCGPGDIPRAFVIAPDTDTAAITLERAIARLEENEELRACVIGEPTKGVITLRRPDGREVRFEVKAASRGGRTVRGRSIICLILDEAALFYGDHYVVNDREIVKAARPRLLRGGVILLASTPWAEDGLFYDLFAKNHARPITAIVAQASTLVMRDHDPEIAAMVALEREEDPDNAARELDAQFIAGGSSLFFDAEAIAIALTKAPLEGDNLTKGAGADLALVRDSSALAIVAKDAAENFGLIETDEKKPEKGQPLKLSAVVKAFAAVLRQHGLEEFTADGHAREPAREWTDVEGITIESAPEGREGKWLTYSLLRSLLNEGRFVLPNHPRLIAQLRAVRSKPMPGGGYQITSPRRKGAGHGDLVSAMVLAVHAANEARSLFLLSSDDNHHHAESVYRFGEARGF
jgi:hypothetical protein